MRRNTLVCTLAFLCLVSLPSCASAQQEQPQFALWQQVHINPGKAVEYEQVRADRNAGMAEAKVAFGRKVFAWDGGIYTLEIPLSNMADLDRMRTQEAAMSAGDSTLA